MTCRSRASSRSASRTNVETLRHVSNEIESNNTTNTVQVLDYAVPADEHSRPRRFLIVFVAGVLSFFASTSYVIGGSYVHRLKQRWHAQNAG